MAYLIAKFAIKSAISCYHLTDSRVYHLSYLIGHQFWCAPSPPPPPPSNRTQAPTAVHVPAAAALPALPASVAAYAAALAATPAAALAAATPAAYPIDSPWQLLRNGGGT